MLTSFGKWASSKGMGVVPDLDDLSINDARNAIVNAGFRLRDESPLGNGSGATSGNNGKAKRRNDTGQLLDYESYIDFEYYVYTEVSVSPAVSPTVSPSVGSPSVGSPSVGSPSVGSPSVGSPSVGSPSVGSPVQQLIAPSLSLASSGNAGGGMYYQIINLTNLDAYDQYGYGTVSFSPTWDNFEGQYPEYIRDHTPGTYSLTVTASRSGYESASSTITYTISEPSVSPSVSPTVSPSVSPTVSPSVSPTVSPSVSPTVGCTPVWNFGNYWDSEYCIDGSLYYETGYYEYTNNCGYYDSRSITDSSGYCCPC